MTRRTARPEPGLDALRAAVAGARAPRAWLTARDLSEPGRALPARVRDGDGRLRAGSVPEPRAVSGGDDTGPRSEAVDAYVLVQRAQAGDHDAFGELYDRYVAMVYRYVRYRTGNLQLAEDLTSETFTRALGKIAGFTWRDRDPGAWFVTIARNLVADHYKSSRYRLELTTDDVAAEGPLPTVPGPEDAVLAGLQCAELLDAVRQLNPEQQECIALRFLQDLTLAETAYVMGKNAASIKALQYRAVRSLARLLPSDGDA